jgi:nitroimidazol reductase NimA-like FMN-containing flavoprotein (pyridoxamine 5'-phosphate oxidase superfamily)
MTEQFTPTEKTKLRRIPKRGVYEREEIYQILDEGFICHVGFTDGGKTFVIPTGYARLEDKLLIHGSSASRMMREMAQKIEVCVTVTLLDGLVLARSAFHHSMNYRSVIIFGTAHLITDAKEKYDALKAFTEHIIPNRWTDIRPPNDLELKATTVLSLPIEEASAKIRNGDPVDDEADYSLSVWAGVVPLKMERGQSIRDARLNSDIEMPDYL